MCANRTVEICPLTRHAVCGIILRAGVPDCGNAAAEMLFESKPFDLIRIIPA